MEHKTLFGGLIRLHVLHHAARDAIYGQWIMEELAHHGYRLSAGTLYPLLHDMEKKGYLVSTTERRGKATRRLYRATPAGGEALVVARGRLRELFGEVFRDERIP